MSSIVEMFTNRVAKNARHLGKWAKRERVTCYRIYDRDIPEIPVTLDTYEGDLVLNDYRIDGTNTDWLDDLATAAKSALGAKHCFRKQRERFAHRGDGDQYERQAEVGAWRTVHEGGHAFRVNLSDYIDTGLFLDHRVTRARVAAEPDIQSMLNLFCYTGAFSVYGAAAGMQTTSVDLSKTYLEWAGKNLELNKLDGEVIHSDVREFLAEARRAGRRWDLAVVDPPTFSNSKRMDYVWDIQRDHAALLDDVAAVTSKVIWFSTNLRRFKMEWSPPNAAVSDETHSTLPPDFRDKRIHHAFRIALDK
jgi:23S rRNA G2069 N7-methylase RlmK/C1962 C5-methylase RlmI